MNIPHELIEEIKSNPHIKIIGISGFGGAGKTTLAKKLTTEFDAESVGVDTFQKSNEYSQYSYWEVMDYNRMRDEVIIPFLKKGEGMLVVEGVGLFRTDLLEYFDYTIWVDVPLEEADGRGQKRDEEVYKNLHDQKFYELWRDNDRQCYEKYRPKEIADFIFKNY